MEGACAKVCAYSGAVESPRLRLLRCARCRVTFYRDRASQKAHWRLHGLNCRAVSAAERECVEAMDLATTASSLERDLRRGGSATTRVLPARRAPLAAVARTVLFFVRRAGATSSSACGGSRTPAAPRTRTRRRRSTTPAGGARRGRPLPKKTGGGPPQARGRERRGRRPGRRRPRRRGLAPRRRGPRHLPRAGVSTGLPPGPADGRLRRVPRGRGAQGVAEAQGARRRRG